MVTLEEIVNNSILAIINYAPKVLLVIFVLIFGLWAIAIIERIFAHTLTKKKVEDTLKHFLISFASMSLKIILVITAIGMLGIATTSLVAVLAAASFAVGLALQGSLSNFAGGVLILIFKPFKIGDFIDAQGHMGTVNKIEILTTTLKTPDNKTVIIPNGPLSNSSLVNFSTEENRRVDMVFSISYDDDIEKTHKVLEKLVKEDERILKEPNYAIVLSKLNDSSIDFTVRAWAKTSDFWGVYFDMQKKVKLEFDKNKISIPYPQRDVHLYKH